MKLPIPVNIITGALGVGKTTAVTHLLSQKPPSEKWALLVNEFGALGVDAALVEAGFGTNSSNTGLVVRELAGGCLCCTLSGPLGVAIAQLVRQAKPDRLIIEPSGLGHPAGLLDTLYGEHLRSALDVRAVICLVDVRMAAAELAGTADGVASVLNETFQDQVNVADVLVGHKPDLAGPSQLDDFWRWAEQLYPPKAQVLLATHGHIDAALLDLPRAPVFRPLFNPQAHSSRRRTAQRSARGAAAASTALLPPAVDAETLTSESVAAVMAAARLADDLDGNAEEASAPARAPAPIQLQPGRPLRFASAPGIVSVKTHQQALLPPHQPEQQLQAVATSEEAVAAGSGPAQAPCESGGCSNQEAVTQDSEQNLDWDPDLVPQQTSCGWLFSSEDVFDRGRLAEVLSELWPAAARLKGIFRVGKSSYVVPYLQADGGVELRTVSYRRESRLEVIVPAGPGGSTAAAAQPGAGPPAAGTRSHLAAALAEANWEAVESALLDALLRKG